MAGNADNAELWAEADVYIAPTGTAEPTDIETAWPTGWEAVGLLDGEEGFTESRDEQSNDFYAWGSILVRRQKSQHKRTIRFVALEDNDVVFELVNPGSERTTAAGLTTSTIKVPGRHEFAIGFEVRDGDKVKRRMVKRAEIETVGDVQEAEAGLAVRDITVVLYPEADRTLYTELEGEVPAGP